MILCSWYLIYWSSPCQRPQNHQDEDRKFHDMGWETEAEMYLAGYCYPPGFILKLASIDQNENGQPLGPRAIGNIPYFQILWVILAWATPVAACDSGLVEGVFTESWSSGNKKCRGWNSNPLQWIKEDKSWVQVGVTVPSGRSVVWCKECWPDGGKRAGCGLEGHLPLTLSKEQLLETGTVRH